MNSIAFFDLEVEKEKGRIVDIGCLKSDQSSFHENNISSFLRFISDSKFLCGHNILNHDIKCIQKTRGYESFRHPNIIDTLFWSPLLFPSHPYHSLLKDDKLLKDELNNPLNDSFKAKNLFYDEIAAFNQFPEAIKKMFHRLLAGKEEFKSFFEFLSFNPDYHQNTIDLINDTFASKICSQSNLIKVITENPVELAYCLALINAADKYSITPPWVIKTYPDVERIMHLLRNKPCNTGCIYCNKALDPHLGLKRFFGFDSFKEYSGKPLQEDAVRAAVDNKSILVIFPTGGGKSLTFQLPALMSGANSKELTVVISPLQSLMKDQVDNLEKNGITEAVTINGLLDPIERSKSFERVEDGSASLLYISPESLRSKSIERLLLGRTVDRFVIDEAHCFSSWGQDFRVDYLYIGDFIKNLQVKKNIQGFIPVSCFTATAKQKVIEDIRLYFKEKLSLELEVFSTGTSRTNLTYKVYENSSEDEKYNKLRDLVESKDCPAIVYVSRTSRAFKISEKLIKDGFNARPYHGKMDVKEKTENQNAFMSGEVRIMVATSAFGMGVDKKDVGMVIHYDISDSLENYVQEAGRAGRDETITADCFVLFNEDDLGKHFALLNQTKLSIKEIKQVWRAIKENTKFRSKLSNSALEIARKAGWDDSIKEIETRVTTAIAALEQAGYLKRGQNEPRIFANSILTKTAQDAIDKINASSRFDISQIGKAIRIMKNLISARSRKHTSDEHAESRVDYISDNLGIVKEEVFKILTLLREEKILADSKDLTAFIKGDEFKSRSVKIAESFRLIEDFLFEELGDAEKKYHLKELNEKATISGCADVSINKIKIILNFWSIKNWIKRQNLEYSKNHICITPAQPKPVLRGKLERRHWLSKFIIEYLYDKVKNESQTDSGEVTVEFSVIELKEAYEQRQELFKVKITPEDVEDSLFYLSRIEALKIEGGFLVVYNKLSIEKIEMDNKIQYKKDDYQKLEEYYQNKVEQIHIVGEYAKKMVEDYQSALQFVEDYFKLNYSEFLNKYFKGSRQQEIKRNLTPAKFRELFGSLSPTHLSIIKDQTSKYIVVAAGPGSGKTRVLVHKLASLLLMEDVKHEQLLMLTFSRAAATEFKRRLIELYGNAANFIEIKTFHSFCFDLLGRVGSIEKSDDILKNAMGKIRNGEVEKSKITKVVLVIDEAQDIDSREYELINVLIDQNDDLRVIAVGDDDQNIFSFRGSDSKYLEQLMKKDNSTKYELLDNYRSKNNLVKFSDQFVRTINHRLKTLPVISKFSENGSIKIVHYLSENLSTPLVNDIVSTDLSGSTCVLTRTNIEALYITGLLNRNRLRAKLIQTNDGFNLINILEVRTLIDILKSDDDSPSISDEKWESSKSEISRKYSRSSNLDICKNIIRAFESTNTRIKYKSDLEVFIQESKLEDFLSTDNETIFVSTMHKAKGREFDNLFIMLDKFDVTHDDQKRLLYVAMTRAKQNLIIHTNGNYLNNIQTENLQRIEDRTVYSRPEKITMHLNFADVNLGYFEFIQRRLLKILSGDRLIPNMEGCLNTKGEIVLKYSKGFLCIIEDLKKNGYQIKSAKVNFILYWKDNEKEIENLIILPELSFELQYSLQ
jgi:ATP-dependent DNA helicase RecQ